MFVVDALNHRIQKCDSGGNFITTWGAMGTGDGQFFRPEGVAVDAVGVAILKVLGSNAAIMKKKIFEQEQIARAVELGLGASSPLEINVVAADPGSQQYCDRVVEMMRAG